MSVWFVLPSARPREESEPIFRAWQSQGYKIALYINSLTPGVTPPWPIIHGCADRVLDRDQYPGYAMAVNELVKDVLEQDAQCDWIVCAGDDTLPDPTKRAEEIARECSEHFAQLHMDYCEYEPPDEADAGIHRFTAMARLMTGEQMATFGVMQPTADRFGESPNNPDPAMRSAYIDRVCGSPWIGREFAKRINQGKGPLWPEYFHMGEDEELFHVAQNLGVLWQRPDLTHFHQHWGRPRNGERMAPSDRMPAFLKRANSGEEWAAYKKLFAERRAAGFPGSDPL